MITVVRSHRLRSLSRLLAALSLATLGVSACGGGGGDDPPPTGVQGDFSFSISPSTISLEQGENQVVTASLTRTGGFSGRVTATAQGIPAGVTITPLVIDSVASSATATVTAGATAAPGAYTVVIRAVATGVSAKVDTVNLTITAPQVPAFTTAVTPDSLSIEQGDSASVTVSVVRSGGFAGAISGTVSGLPSGVTASGLSIAAGATSGTVTVVVDSVGAPIVSGLVAEGASTPGTSSLVLTTSGEGVEDQVNTIPLTITAPPVPDIAVALTPDSLSLAPGGQGTSTLAITRSGGFAGGVTLALSGTAPTGVTVTLPAAPVAGASAGITVAVAAQTAPGTYPLTIEVSGAGVATRSAVLTLVVPDLGSFSLASQPMGASVAQGDSTTLNIAVTRVAPFVAPVTLTVSGVPAGVTATVTPNPVSGGSATLRLVAAPGAALGGTTLTVAGSGGGLSSAPLSVPLMVTVSGGGGGGNVTYTFCATDPLPAFVAYQDGSGPWMEATAGAGNSYSFNIASGRGGVAVVTPETGGADTEVQYGTTAELNLLGDNSCTSEVAGRSYTGTVAGTTLTDFVRIVAGGAVATVAPFANTYSLQNVSNDPFDLLASSFAANGGAFGRIIIRRDIDEPSGTALPVLDFSSAEAFVPEARPVTIGNSLGEQTNVFANYVLRGGAAGGGFYTDFQPGTSTNRTWYGIPAARQAPGDLHVVGVTAFVSDADLEDARSRTSLHVVRELQPINATLPAPVTAPVFSTSQAGGNMQVEGSYTVQPDYTSFWFLSVAQPAGAQQVDANVTMTSGYANGAGTVSLVVPNLSGLQGWNTAWGLNPAVGYEWSFIGTGGSVGFGLTPGGFSDGAISKSGSVSGEQLGPAN